ncbi:hypothetical protein [Bacillus sp. V5-8f]|nr:hypothetical protein [Bacillus sp. V5-8f]
MKKKLSGLLAVVVLVAGFTLIGTKELPTQFSTVGTKELPTQF